MGNRYLTALAEWCREAGLHTIEDSGWQYRARSSGGFDGDRPWCVMWHHTASDTSPANDVEYICRGSPDAPISNVLLDRTGAVWICAGGATNTNGKGNATIVSRGTIPADTMNTHAVSIEIANDGVGETYPAEQIDAAFRLSIMLTDRLDLAVTDVQEHAVYAPTRKIDPARAEAVAGSWRPKSINSSGTWSVSDLRAELIERSGVDPGPPDPIPPPDPAPPLPEEDDMRLTAAIDENGTLWIGNGIQRRPAPSMVVVNHYIVLANAGCYSFVDANGDQIRQADQIFAVGRDTIDAMGSPII